MNVGDILLSYLEIGVSFICGNNEELTFIFKLFDNLGNKLSLGFTDLF